MLHEKFDWNNDSFYILQDTRKYVAFLKTFLGDRRDVSDNEIIEIIGRVCDVSGTCWDQAMNWHWSHEEIQAVYTCTVRVYTCTVRGQDQVSSTGGFYTETRIKDYNASPQSWWIPIILFVISGWSIFNV